MFLRPSYLVSKFGSSIQNGMRRQTGVTSVFHKTLYRNMCLQVKIDHLSVPVSFCGPEPFNQSRWWEGVICQSSQVASQEEADITNVADVIIQSVKRQSQNIALLDHIGLSKRECTEFMMYSLHFWMVLNHLRSFGVEGKEIIGVLEKQFWDDKDVKECAFYGHSSPDELHLCEKQLYFFELLKALDRSLRENSEISFKQTLLKKIYFGYCSPEDTNKLFSYIMQEMGSLQLTDIETLPIKCDSWGICG